MTDAGELDSGELTVDPVLAKLTEQITRKLQAGEVVEFEDYARRYPRWAGPIRRLLPTLLQLSELDHATEPTRGERPSHESPAPPEAERPTP